MFRTLRPSTARAFAAAVVALGWLVFAAAPAAAQTAPATSYPNRPVRFVVPFPPAGNTDVVARTIGQKLAELWGQQIVIDNRGGANTILGAEIAARAPADGYTLFLTTATTMAINPSLYRKLPYDPVRDFTLITPVVHYYYVIAAHGSLPSNNVKELVAAARAKPGTITYASSGNGSSGHLGGALLESMANIRLLHVPYKGTGPAFNDLLSGQVNLQVTGVATVQGHLRTGRLKLLGVGGDKRMAAYPDVPTVDESGFPGYRAGTWFGVVTPAGLAQPLVDRLHRDIVRVMGYADVRERMASLGFDILTQSPEEFGRFIREDTQRWAKVAKESGARVD